MENSRGVGRQPLLLCEFLGRLEWLGKGLPMAHYTDFGSDPRRKMMSPLQFCLFGILILMD